jgi:hypothetical protein
MVFARLCKELSAALSVIPVVGMEIIPVAGVVGLGRSDVK